MLSAASDVRLYQVTHPHTHNHRILEWVRPVIVFHAEIIITR